MQNFFPIEMTAEERDQLLLDWQTAKSTLDTAKAKELELRNRIVNETNMFDPAKEEGTETVGLGNGWSVKAVKKINYTVANKEGEAFGVLQAISNFGEVETHIARELFGFDANLRITKYRELLTVNPEAYKLVQKIVTSKPATPTLELVAPKAQK